MSMYGCLEREKRRTAPENHRQSFCKLALGFPFLFYEQRENKNENKETNPVGNGSGNTHLSYGPLLNGGHVLASSFRVFWSR